MSNTKDTLLDTLKRGFSIQYHRLSVNDMSDVQQLVKRPYQVHSDHHNFKFSGFFESPEDAIDKFMDIYRKVRYNK